MPESSPTGRAFFDAWTARAGFVSVTGGSGATAVDPYFLRRASIGPNSIARYVQDSTQTGASPFSRRSRQPSHLSIFLAFTSNCGAP